ncbi:MAG: YkgB family protein [Bacteroidales bacterium]|nr:YkgB family protein [Bacteroidales bacterium]
MNTLIKLASKILVDNQHRWFHFMRIAIFVVMAWIGGLKAFQYEADGIVPFVSNSPFMSFLYSNSSKTAINEKGETVKEYVLHKNPEGKMVVKNIEWHKSNGTYAFAYGLGAMIIVIGLFTLLGIWLDTIGLIGGLLTFGMSIVTLSFLITTPETWVPNLGGDLPTPAHGFPYLSAAGRLVIKDIIMMAGGLLVATDCARRILSKQQKQA